MVENGLYVIKRDFLEIIKSLGGDCDVNNGDKRPVFCCMKDNRIEGLYWAIPTSDLSHRNNGQRAYYEICLACPDKMESRRPNYFPQHITDIKKYLVNELSHNEKGE